MIISLLCLCIGRFDGLFFMCVWTLLESQSWWDGLRRHRSTYLLAYIAAISSSFVYAYSCSNPMSTGQVPETRRVELQLMPCWLLLCCGWSDFLQLVLSWYSKSSFWSGFCWSMCPM